MILSGLWVKATAWHLFSPLNIIFRHNKLLNPYFRNLQQLFPKRTKLMRSYLLLAAVMVCCFMACQKEPDATLLTPTACKLDKIVYFDDNDPVDTVGFEYSGDKASKVNYSDYYTQ